MGKARTSPESAGSLIGRTPSEKPMVVVSTDTASSADKRLASLEATLFGRVKKATRELLLHYSEGLIAGTRRVKLSKNA